MESHEEINHDKQIKMTLLNHPSKSLGGIKTLPFILANEGFERAAFYGLQPNMILYLMGAYGLDMATGSNIIFLWSAATNFTPIICALLTDTYVGRFRMIAFGSISALLGMTLLWSTTMRVKPSQETPTTFFQLVYLCISLGLMSIGAGGLRSCGLAFGADQLQSEEDAESQKPSSNQARALESLVNWYYFAMTFAMLFALTCIVYIQDHMGWQVGFGVPVALMLASSVSFLSASSYYVKVKPVASALSSPAQVMVASWRNREYELSNQLGTEHVYHAPVGSVFQVPTERLRFLNKACMINDQSRDLALNDENPPNPWRLCTVDQVEEFKSILKVIPLWSSGILICVNTISPSSFLVIQAKSMDRHVFTSSFEIPPASLGIFALLSVMTWLVLYDRVLIPLASKCMGKAVRIDALTRVGCGLLLSSVGMVVAGCVENARRETTLSMSALWLVPQVCLIGLGDGLTVMGQIEFFYSEFPKSLSSISSNLHNLCFGIGSIIASLILSIVDYTTKQGGNESWVSKNPSKGHYDYYFWVLASITFLNFIYFLLCKRAYDRDNKRVSQENSELH